MCDDSAGLAVLGFLTFLGLVRGRADPAASGPRLPWAGAGSAADVPAPAAGGRFALGCRAFGAGTGPTGGAVASSSFRGMKAVLGLPGWAPPRLAAAASGPSARGLSFARYRPLGKDKTRGWDAPSLAPCALLLSSPPRVAAWFR